MGKAGSDCNSLHGNLSKHALARFKSWMEEREGQPLIQKKKESLNGQKKLEEFSFILLSFLVEALNPEFVRTSPHGHPNAP